MASNVLAPENKYLYSSCTSPQTSSPYSDHSERLFLRAVPCAYSADEAQSQCFHSNFSGSSTGPSQCRMSLPSPLSFQLRPASRIRVSEFGALPKPDSFLVALALPSFLPVSIAPYINDSYCSMVFACSNTYRTTFTTCGEETLSELVDVTYSVHNQRSKTVILPACGPGT